MPRLRMDHTEDRTARRRVVVFTTRLDDAGTVETVEALVEAHPDWRFLVVGGGLHVRRSRWIRHKLRRLRREPLSYPLELTGQALSRLTRRSGRGRVASPAPRLPALDALPGVTTRAFDRIHSAECLAAVTDFAPWLGLSIGAPLLKPALFTIPERGTLNVHKSLLPEYRGMPPGFWELHDGASESGVSVHWLDSGLDTGDVVVRRRVPIDRFATPFGLRTRLDGEAIPALLEAVRLVAAGAAQGRPQGEASTPTRSRPAFRVARRVAAHCAGRRPRGGALREVAKRAVLWGFVHVFAPLRNHARARRGTCHATVLLWHRISDRFHDSITTGVEQFDRQLALLRRHYEVIDLESFLARRGVARRRPVAVLTFDDGYRDNHDAARLLRRHGLPCTFFLSTRIVGTDRPFPYDSGLDETVPALSWDDVRTMQRHGFTFGNHTQTHANVAQLPLEAALAEVRGAAEDLRRELGDRGAERWFAYPFGWQDDISAEVRAALRSLGVEACFSAYGGVNPPAFDPMDVRRQGVAANVSDLAFRALVEGWRVGAPREKR